MTNIVLLPLEARRHRATQEHCVFLSQLQSATQAVIGAANRSKNVPLPIELKVAVIGELVEVASRLQQLSDSLMAKIQA